MRYPSFLCVAVLMGATLLAGCPDVRLAPNVERTRNIVFGLGYVNPSGDGQTYSLRELQMDMLEPNDIPAMNRPALLLLHGGAFSSGSRNNTELVRLANDIAREGVVCFLADYRLEDENAPAPANLSISIARAAHAAFVDAKVALRHLRAHAEFYGIDPNRIAVLGESAGAFSALAAAISDAGDFASDGPSFPVPEENNPAFDPKPNAVISLWGSAAPVLDDFDPFDPPVMVVHGVLDSQPATLFPEALRIRDACRRNGIPYEFYPMLTEGHRAWNAIIQGKPIAAKVVEFLAEYL